MFDGFNLGTIFQMKNHSIASEVSFFNRMNAQKNHSIDGGVQRSSIPLQRGKLNCGKEA